MKQFVIGQPLPPGVHDNGSPNPYYVITGSGFIAPVANGDYIVQDGTGWYPMKPGVKSVTTYYSLPATCEAYQYKHGNRGNGVFIDGDQYYVVTIHGQRTIVMDGDYIVKEPKGDGYYPVKPEIFEKRWSLSRPEKPAYSEKVVQAMIVALGYQAENLQAQIEGRRPPYDGRSFAELVEEMKQP
jgi:hypothetical protein